MRPVYISGMGLLSPAGIAAEELGGLMPGTASAAAPADFAKPVEFSPGVPASKVRRASRYAKLAVAAASLCLEDAGFDGDKAEIGTVFLTGYGSVESYADFTDSVVDGVPSLASPTVFSYTVPNSCLGQTCIAHGFRGPSTMLLGGDPLEYAALLLSGNKASHILCGAVEEGSDDLRASFRAAGAIPGNLAEGAAMLLLSREPGGDGCCRLTGFASAALPSYPYVSAWTESEAGKACRAVKGVLSVLGAEGEPELILTADNGSSFDETEKQARQEVFGALPAGSCKGFLGEALAASYLENIAWGAALIRRGAASSLVVTGLDAHGNYLAARLEA